MSHAHGSQRAALRNGPLVRYVIAVALNVIAESAVFIGVLVYAFDDGGATATGYSAVAMLVPYVLFAPIAGSIAERYPPQRVRIGAMILQLAGFAVGALAAFRDLPGQFVVAACMVGVAATTALGPAGAVLRPAIVRSSRELTVANLWVGYADSASVLGGPLLATGMLLLGGAPAVIAACAGATALALLFSLISRPLDPPGGSATDQLGALALMRRNIAEVRSRPGIGGVLTVAGGQYFVVGAFDIVLVVLAETRLDLGESGPGILNSAFGLGALLSGAVATVLIRRNRLAPVIIVALIVLAVAAAVLGAAVAVITALALLPVIGLARAEIGLLAGVLLQRSAAPEKLASVYAVIELSSGVGLIVGSICAQGLIAAWGVEAALYGISVFFLGLLAATFHSLRVADDSADVPVVAMSLLRHLPVFAPLPRPALEAVARSAEEVHVAAGANVIEQGGHGDRFYAVADGRFEVTRNGEHVHTVERGRGFGEIALLADVPRTATVTARTPGSVWAIERSPFLVAVTGHDSSRQAAWGVVHSLHPDLAGNGDGETDDAWSGDDDGRADSAEA